MTDIKRDEIQRKRGELGRDGVVGRHPVIAAQRRLKATDLAPSKTVRACSVYAGYRLVDLAAAAVDGHSPAPETTASLFAGT